MLRFHWSHTSQTGEASFAQHLSDDIQTFSTRACFPGKERRIDSSETSASNQLRQMIGFPLLPYLQKSMHPPSIRLFNKVSPREMANLCLMQQSRTTCAFYSLWCRAIFAYDIDCYWMAGPCRAELAARFLQEAWRQTSFGRRYLWQSHGARMWRLTSHQTLASKANSVAVVAKKRGLESDCLVPRRISDVCVSVCVCVCVCVDGLIPGPAPRSVRLACSFHGRRCVLYTCEYRSGCSLAPKSSP